MSHQHLFSSLGTNDLLEHIVFSWKGQLFKIYPKDISHTFNI